MKPNYTRPASKYVVPIEHAPLPVRAAVGRYLASRQRNRLELKEALLNMGFLSMPIWGVPIGFLRIIGWFRRDAQEEKKRASNNAPQTNELDDLGLVHMAISKHGPVHPHYADRPEYCGMPPDTELLETHHLKIGRRGEMVFRRKE